jgi:SulP family sulfate permease
VTRRTVLPLADLVDAEPASLRADVLPALAVAAMSVPQGLAWAMVAGLPPVVGLWSATIPTVVAALFRSSRSTVVGPTNAVSVLVATSAVAQAPDPLAAAGTLALLVGGFQIAAGATSLAGLVDFVSGAVVTGLVTGAATLMMVGQLPHVTGTAVVSGDILSRSWAWGSSLGSAHVPSVLLAVGTVATIVALRRRLPRGIPMLLATLGATALSVVLHLDEGGVRTLSTNGWVGLPPFGLPSPGGVVGLLPTAVAAAVLSLVETTAIDRATAERTGQHLDPRLDFVGLGLANAASALFGGYPVSGSLARSALVQQLGGRTRLASVWAAVLLLAALPLLGMGLASVPVPVIAGVVLIAAFDLVDPARLRAWFDAAPADRFALVGTVLATWLLPFDQAIGVGVTLSLVMFLRRSQLLVVRPLWVGEDGRLREVDEDHPPPVTVEHPGRCRAVTVVQVEGPLFFGSAQELLDALTEVMEDDEARVLVARLKRADSLDRTAARTLRHATALLERTGRRLLLVGTPPGHLLDPDVPGLTWELAGTEPPNPTWFPTLPAALSHATGLVGRGDAHGCGLHCPVAVFGPPLGT